MTGPKNVSDKQLAANRRNAQLSTGPRTPEGKARSRWNALKHGVLAQAVIPEPLQPYESRQQFDHLLATLRQELAPQSAIEEMLVETIAACYWRLARVVRAEAAAISHRLVSARDDWGQACREAEREASRYAKWGHTHQTLREQVIELRWVMDDAQRLRDFLSKLDPRWSDAPQEQLFDAAQSRLENLQRQLADQESQELAAHRGMSSIPEIEHALNLSTYETRLTRQLTRALNELERLQRRRSGEPVPPPLNITITDTS
jgi:hypothetical protein